RAGHHAGELEAAVGRRKAADEPGRVNSSPGGDWLVVAVDDLRGRLYEHEITWSGKILVRSGYETRELLALVVRRMPTGGEEVIGAKADIRGLLGQKAAERARHRAILLAHAEIGQPAKHLREDGRPAILGGVDRTILAKHHVPIERPDLGAQKAPGPAVA